MILRHEMNQQTKAQVHKDHSDDEDEVFVDHVRDHKRSTWTNLPKLSINDSQCEKEEEKVDESPGSASQVSKNDVKVMINLLFNKSGKKQLCMRLVG